MWTYVSGFIIMTHCYDTGTMFLEIMYDASSVAGI